MEYQEILVEIKDYIATVTLNRPQKLNAYTTLMGDELTHAYTTLSKDNDVRVIIMTGAGRGFCSGADVGGVFQKQIKDEGKSSSSSRMTSQVVHPRSGLHYALYNCAKPTIAAINGPAVGIGLTLTLLQDIRIMAEEASIGAIFARMGLMPELGLNLHVAEAHWPSQSVGAYLHRQSVEGERSARYRARQPSRPR